MNDSQPSQVNRKTSIFREEALQARAAKQYGTVILTGLGAPWFITLGFMLLACAIVAFFALFSTTRKVQAQGVLLPSAGLVRVTPQQAGIVAAIKVVEGQAVKAGDVLFVVLNERSNASGESSGQAVSAMLAQRGNSLRAEAEQAGQQYRHKIAAARDRASTLRADIERLAEQQLLQERRVRLAEETEKRFADLFAANYLSRTQLQEKQAELIEQQQRLADLKRSASSLRRDMATSQAEALDLASQGEREKQALMRSGTELKQELAENEARRETYVRATHAGTATAITAAVGQPVAPATTLATILPADASLAAEVYVTSRAIGFIRPGTPVLLRYQAYPYQKFGQFQAIVHEVANAALRPDELQLANTQLVSGAEPLYRVRLQLRDTAVRAYGRDLPLKPGMQFDASVMLEQRKLYEWVLEPLYSISGRM